LNVRKALQFLKNQKNKPDAKLREEDADAAIEREERHILALERVTAAVERLTAAVDAQVAVSRDLAAHAQSQGQVFKDLSMQQGKTAATLVRAIEILETVHQAALNAGNGASDKDSDLRRSGERGEPVAIYAELSVKLT